MVIMGEQMTITPTLTPVEKLESLRKFRDIVASNWSEWRQYVHYDVLTNHIEYYDTVVNPPPGISPPT